LQALLAFVDTVDDTRITLMCRRDLEQHMRELCTPEAGTAADVEIPAESLSVMGVQQLRNMYPYRCLGMPFKGAGSVYEQLVLRAAVSCVNPETGRMDETGERALNDIANDLFTRMTTVLSAECRAADPNNQAFFVEDTSVAGAAPGTLPATVLPQYVSALFNQGAALSQEAEARFAATVPEAINIQFGEAVGGSGARTIVGRATIMQPPRDINGHVLENMVSSENLQPRGWGMCEVIAASVQCELMNSLATTDGPPVAVFNPANAQCEFRPEYYRVVCEQFLGSGLAGGPWEAVWDDIDGVCEYMRVR
jgi:hypothetical protein